MSNPTYVSGGNVSKHPTFTRKRRHSLTVVVAVASLMTLAWASVMVSNLVNIPVWVGFAVAVAGAGVYCLGWKLGSMMIEAAAKQSPSN